MNLPTPLPFIQCWLASGEHGRGFNFGLWGWGGRRHRSLIALQVGNFILHRGVRIWDQFFCLSAAASSLSSVAEAPAAAAAAAACAMSGERYWVELICPGVVLVHNPEGGRMQQGGRAWLFDLQKADRKATPSKVARSPLRGGGR